MVASLQPRLGMPSAGRDGYTAAHGHIAWGWFHRLHLSTQRWDSLYFKMCDKVAEISRRGFSRNSRHELRGEGGILCHIAIRQRAVCICEHVSPYETHKVCSRYFDNQRSMAQARALYASGQQTRQTKAHTAAGRSVSSAVKDKNYA